MLQRAQTVWQTVIETGMETGQPPLLDLGLSPGILPGLTAALALISFAEARLDLTQPRVLVGGEGSSWLVALLATPQTAPPHQAPALTIIYGGADQATQMATVGITQSPSPATPGQHRLLPRSLTAWFAPAEHAGASSWPALVFQALRAVKPPAADDRWLAGAGGLLALALVILALLV
jgi:hypothetical protein